MFPADWTWKTLVGKLQNSNTIGDRITLKDGIVIRRQGKTYFPEVGNAGGADSDQKKK